MVSNLLPCPFCGGTPEIIRMGTPRQSSQIGCTECGALLESNENEWSTGTNWNRRVDIKENN